MTPLIVDVHLTQTYALFGTSLYFTVEFQKVKRYRCGERYYMVNSLSSPPIQKVVFLHPTDDSLS